LESWDPEEETPAVGGGVIAGDPDDAGLEDSDVLGLWTIFSVFLVPAGLPLTEQAARLAVDGRHGSLVTPSLNSYRTQTEPFSPIR